MSRVFSLTSALLLFFTFASASFAQKGGKGGGKGGGGEEPPADLPSFIYEELGTLGGNKACSFGMNDVGDVVGVSEDSAGQRRAFLYTDEWEMIDLNSLVDPDSGWFLATAADINNSGVIAAVGMYDFDGDGVVANSEYKAVRFLPDVDGDGYGTVESLTVDIGTQAIAINEAGDVLGSSWLPASSPSPFLWSPEEGFEPIGQWLRDGQYALGTYPRDLSERNENGDVYFAAYSDSWALRYSTATGEYLELGNLTDVSWGPARALGVNRSGAVSGVSRTGRSRFDDDLAFAFTDLNGMESLGTVGSAKGCRDSSLGDVNDFGEMVGGAHIDCDFVTPVIFSPTHGLLDLAPLIINPPVFVTGSAQNGVMKPFRGSNLPGRINEAGQMCGPWSPQETAPGFQIETVGPAYRITPVEP